MTLEKISTKILTPVLVPTLATRSIMINEDNKTCMIVYVAPVSGFMQVQ